MYSLIYRYLCVHTYVTYVRLGYVHVEGGRGTRARARGPTLRPRTRRRRAQMCATFKIRGNCAAHHWFEYKLKLNYTKWGSAWNNGARGTTSTNWMQELLCLNFNPFFPLSFFQNGSIPFFCDVWSEMVQIMRTWFRVNFFFSSLSSIFDAKKGCYTEKRTRKGERPRQS